MNADLNYSQVFSPVGSCSECGRELLLECDNADNIINSLVAACWSCSYFRRVDLDFVEIYLNRIFPATQTWRIFPQRESDGDGIIVTGDKLFTTTVKKRNRYKYFDSYDDDGYEISEKIYDLEETILMYWNGFKHLGSSYDLEMAYHYASEPHDCLVRDNLDYLKCKENVNFIVDRADSIFVEHFNIYSTLLTAWRKVCHDFDNGLLSNAVANETELRTHFITTIKEVDPFDFDITIWQDRYIAIDGQNFKPDAQYFHEVVIELKSFFRDQHYSLPQAIKVIKDDLKKMSRYSKVFEIGLLFCLSDKFTASQIKPSKYPDPGFVFRMLIHSSLE